MAGIPGLGDRAAMEKERLTRLAARNGQSAGTKRERSISPPATTRPTKVTKLAKSSATTELVPSSQNVKVSETTFMGPQDVDLDSPSPPAVVEAPTSLPQQIPQVTASVPTLDHPKGVIKKTWAFGHDRTGDDIKIEEVLEKNTLRTGVLSAFQWDTEWVSSKVNMQQTKFVYIMQAKEQSLRDQMLEETEHIRKTLRLCFPPMDGQINCMHSKLMLLFHPHKLRVAIPSANLMPYDWGETGIMENSVFIIDLPRLANGVDFDQTCTSFAEELLYFLEKQGLDQDIRQGIRNFDFGATSAISFIHSSGGIHYGDDMRKTGFMGLNKAVREHNLVAEADLQLDFAASSIGSLNDDQLRNIHTAARGQFPHTLPPKRTSKKRDEEVLSGGNSDSLRSVFRIYFPTLETVANSTGGTDNGGTICFQRRWWEGSNRFPRDCFRDYKSMRSGLLSHNKLIYARGHRKKETSKSVLPSAGKKSVFDGWSSAAAAAKTGGEAEKGGGGGKVKEGGGARDAEGKEDEAVKEAAKDVAWVYMGSANMSESAWGKLVWDAKRKEWKINCKNWECGVLMPVPDAKLKDPVYEQGSRLRAQEKEDQKGQGEAVVSLEVFDGVCKVPFQYPAEPIGDREPWYFTEPHP